MWTISSSFVWRTNDSKRGNPINTRLDSYTSLNKVWWRHQVCWNIPVLGLHPKAPNKWLCFYKNVKKIDEFQHSREENVMNSVQLPDNFLTMILAWSTEHIHFFLLFSPLLSPPLLSPPLLLLVFYLPAGGSPQRFLPVTKGSFPCCSFTLWVSVKHLEINWIQ